MCVCFWPTTYLLGVGTVPVGSTITLPYNNFSASGTGTPYVADPSNLTIAAYDGTQWTTLAPTVGSADPSAMTVTVTLPASLSRSYTALALASTSVANPLPVQLVDFGAVKKGADGQLSWKTASEISSDHFEVQASSDGSTWQALGEVAAAGSSSTQHHYDYLDKNIARYGVATVYYRLRQVDRDAKSTYSSAVTLSPEAVAWQILAYPNPFENEFTVQLTTTETSPRKLAASTV